MEEYRQMRGALEEGAWDVPTYRGHRNVGDLAHGSPGESRTKDGGTMEEGDRCV